MEVGLRLEWISVGILFYFAWGQVFFLIVLFCGSFGGFVHVCTRLFGSVFVEFVLY